MIPISMPVIGREEVRAVREVLESGVLTQGPKIEKFEEVVSRYVGVGHGVAVSSGTAALMVALEALGVGKGDEVVTTPFTFVATVNAILHSSAKPVFVDIDAETFNMDPGMLEGAVTERAKAVLPVHLYGQPCDMDRVVGVCKERGLNLVEDCAQSLGAEYDGKKAGSFGAASVFSFYATKNITTGEGGMVLTSSEDVWEKARMIRNHGRGVSEEHEFAHYNYRMTDMQAALGVVQMKKLEEFNRKRVENAKILTEGLEGVGWIGVPKAIPKARHVFNQYTIRALNGRRDKLLKHLNESGVGARVYYSRPIHMEPAYRFLGLGRESFPEAERAAGEVVSLPVHPSLSRADLNKIVDSLKSFR